MRRRRALLAIEVELVYFFTLQRNWGRQIFGENVFMHVDGLRPPGITEWDMQAFYGTRKTLVKMEMNSTHC